MPKIELTIQQIFNIYADTHDDNVRKAIVYSMENLVEKNDTYVVPAWESRIVSCSSFGDNKISVIKVVRGFTGMGLKEAKDFVEGFGDNARIKVSDPERFKREVATVGGTIVIHPVS